MAHVDFLILPDDQPESLQQYACRRAENQWSTGRRVLIQTDTAEQSELIDNLLWELRDDSFIPHGIAVLEPTDEQQPILISHQKVNDHHFQSVINLSARPCDITDASDELNIEEILNQDEQRKQPGRQNYKIYRELGYTLQHHTLESIDD